ncbi:thermonuclease family protein [Bacillus sp. V5-8f]|uniref:thermonuclease family protein n=1 Tax=Bacillus sp. V5-8f TaxID=2053044 RepID=UPI000C79428E|nr:thermonuclease family protein [Bacillus sp. V5-8f]PLT33786.1 thermonuclease [Bacillus sp. V5-8f]
MKVYFKLTFLLAIVGIISFGLIACSPGNNYSQQSNGPSSKQEETNPDGVKLLSATVTNVVDGDTIDVKINNKEERVRLLLIDTPETKHPSKPIQPYGPEAFDHTKHELLGKQVGLEKDVSERDRYGRMLAYIWVDGELYNETLIKKGLARVATFPPDVKYVNRFIEKQKEAQKKGVGIWSIENYVQEKRYNSDIQQKRTSITNNEQNQDVIQNEECDGKIKGNKNSRIYHLPSGAHYDEVAADNVVWFCTEDEAKAEGYRKSKN